MIFVFEETNKMPRLRGRIRYKVLSNFKHPENFPAKFTFKNYIYENLYSFKVND